ncbi:STAS domain protein [Pseudomonas tremae]|uniref:STAS domain protein n=3 Tax=Pseudomonas syringae group TaxID=136849 RepID=A0AA40P0Y2_9PSED|nr:STAS domain protein [Pseudomonas tremae]RMM37760.1 STAS domain protein [Pseudomonas coronafaciens pv. oryzae]RMM86057.1 STAS domain protein [Pseudomonas coronafaciens pv. striafaciens]RMS89441.1 STAS domain protein [Pseudomonas coronafaciens pv. oryzae]
MEKGRGSGRRCKSLGGEAISASTNAGRRIQADPALRPTALEVSMTTSAETSQDAARVQIEGELTIYTVTELAARILPQVGTAARLDVDLSQVTEMDGAGLQLLAVIQREAEKNGTALHMTGQSKAVTETFELCNPGVVL